MTALDATATVTSDAIATASTSIAAAVTTATLPILPAVVPGAVAHARLGPVQRRFRHRVYQWLVDLDALPVQPWYLKPFAGFSAADHLGDPHRSIKANVEAFLALHDVSLGERGRVVMLANARVLGHVFDPISVFWCFDFAGSLACVVAEVHNTYGERHAYLLHPDASGRASTDKSLYVSPFFDVSGQYELRFTLSPTHVSSTVALRRESVVAFTATFSGKPAPATPATVAGQLLRHPLMPHRVSALIRIHGAKMWLRRFPVQLRPSHRVQKGV